MRLNTPADLTRLLGQCVMLAEAQPPPAPATYHPRIHQERRKCLLHLLLEPLTRRYWWAGYKTPTSKR